MSKTEINGYIKFLKLENFWFNTLSEESRNKILIYLDSSNNDINLLTKESLINTEIFGSSASRISIMGILFSIIDRDSDEIDKIILDKIEEEAVDEKAKVDLHFIYQSLITQNYKKRESIEYLEKAKYYCLKQIAISEHISNYYKKNEGFIPSHIGFKQLSIILEKEKKYSEAINYCKMAINQGWSGDWNNRISKLEKKNV